MRWQSATPHGGIPLPQTDGEALEEMACGLSGRRACALPNQAANSFDGVVCLSAPPSKRLHCKRNEIRYTRQTPLSRVVMQYIRSQGCGFIRLIISCGQSSFVALSPAAYLRGGFQTGAKQGKNSRKPHIKFAKSHEVFEEFLCHLMI